jgi:hypothetical protein
MSKDVDTYNCIVTGSFDSNYVNMIISHNKNNIFSYKRFIEESYYFENATEFSSTLTFNLDNLTIAFTITTFEGTVSIPPEVGLIVSRGHEVFSCSGSI